MALDADNVFLIGLLSIVQILWIQRISERLHLDDDHAEAIMDVRINTAIYHLRLEEVLNHDSEETADVKEALYALDQAITLVDATLSGGILEHGRDSVPLTDLPLRARAEAIKALLVDLKIIWLERLRNPGKAGIGSVLERWSETVFKEALRKTKDQISGRESYG